MKCKECKNEIGDAIHIQRKNGERVCLSCMPFVEPKNNNELVMVHVDISKQQRITKKDRREFRKQEKLRRKQEGPNPWKEM